jgi:hypothetical protein
MRKWLYASLVVLMVPAFTACKGKACKGISVPEHVKKMGIVMSGGTLCKDGRGVASVDYPDEKPAGVLGKYKGLFEKKGMKVEDAGKKTLFAHKGDLSFLVISGVSKERKVTFAITKYCATPSCTRRLKLLSKALGKYKDKK